MAPPRGRHKEGTPDAAERDESRAPPTQRPTTRSLTSQSSDSGPKPAEGVAKKGKKRKFSEAAITSANEQNGRLNPYQAGSNTAYRPGHTPFDNDGEHKGRVEAIGRDAIANGQPLDPGVSQRVWSDSVMSETSLDTATSKRDSSQWTGLPSHRESPGPDTQSIVNAAATSDATLPFVRHSSEGAIPQSQRYSSPSGDTSARQRATVPRGFAAHDRQRPMRASSDRERHSQGVLSGLRRHSNHRADHSERDELPSGVRVTHGARHNGRVDPSDSAHPPHRVIHSGRDVLPHDTQDGLRVNHSEPRSRASSRHRVNHSGDVLRSIVPAVHDEVPTDLSNMDLYEKPSPAPTRRVQLRIVEVGSVKLEPQTPHAVEDVEQAASVRGSDPAPANIQSEKQQAVPVALRSLRVYDYRRWFEKGGYGAIAALAYRHACYRNEPVVRDVSAEAWTWRTVPVLLSMDRRVLSALLSVPMANLSRSASEWPHRDQWTNRQTSPDAPCVYVRTYGNQFTKVAPTPQQLRRVTQRIRQYCAPGTQYVAVAQAIDNSSREKMQQKHSERGWRYYLSSQGAPLPQRVAIAQRFCDQFDARLKQLPVEAQDRPLEKRQYYVGVSSYFARREIQHGNPSGTSYWLMHLFFEALVCELGNRAHWNFFDTPVAYFADNKEYCAGELLLTLISDSSADNGGGFCVCAAGLSSLNTQSRTAGEWKTLWNEATTFRERFTDWNANIQRELKVQEDYKATANANRARDLETRAASIRKIEELEQRMASLKADQTQEFRTAFAKARSDLARLEQNVGSPATKPLRHLEAKCEIELRRFEEAPEPSGGR